MQKSTTEETCPLYEQKLGSIENLELHVRDTCPFLHCIVKLETGKIKQFFD